ncbi:hypothetical protein ZEAMMB73_Zm00001d001989 [Zea mays]|uniref:Uncharacterized protein n=2 Tax=Zea mays TaxID=4577 RepID=A0A1D6DVF3_MAIZE|nr:hypothetical protein ZEAMMB73_Zm00001d001989 [Zea mays]
MMKPSCVLLLSSLLVATLAATSSSSPPYSVGKHPGWLLVLGRKGRELGQSSGYHYYQHQSKQPEVSSYSLSYISPRTCSTFIPLSAHQRLNHEPEGSIQHNVQTENLTQLSVHGVQLQGVAMEVKKPEEEATARRTADQSGDAETGLIYSADYSSVAMHAASPPTAKPKHRHPTRP